MPTTLPVLDHAFVTAYDAGTPQVVWTRLVADLETPVSAMLKLADGRPYSFLLDSVEGGAVRGRYSIIGLKPDVLWRARSGQAEINRSVRHDPTAFVADGPALDSLRRLVEESRIDLPAGLPPMAAMVAGYLGYDVVRLVEPQIADTNPDPIDVPDGIFLRPTLMAIFDNVEHMVTLVTPVRREDGVSAAAAYTLAQERLADAVTDFQRTLPYRREAFDTLSTPPAPMGTMAPATYCEMVKKAKEYILAGDIFQVVLSQRFTVPFRLPPFSLYRSLRRTNPSPFMFYLDMGAFHIVGASPEILVRLRDGQVTIRPIAGTRKRGATPDEDKTLAADLLADPKELAEHLMLLDLGRNDVGRVAKVGTVSVRADEKMFVEYYSHVMHIVSNVTGEIAPGHDALDALFAGFPAGTVSGAPKVRAMEIIDELEPVRRGFYAGTVGYFAANGSMDTCISLRTCLVKDGVMHVQAGAGIVADSDPMAEYEECLNKAKALVRAAEEAVRYAAG
ncbi:anthranilate synthase component I [Rhodospirillum rubrum]|uniref:anthranilate synthase component I n=1 Tax=Rhodospirillum rubrum TaxID=1085 RepID=UPI0019050B51|nr:anthranilate synthase component I [Rhodospirillum rubrum]MBK1663688.1 anthranilate synthase component I [Rhodospirillum rubrum]MBK1677428.1 anthranilate synthase component I [Rhodospirillum rubrum]